MAISCLTCGAWVSNEPIPSNINSPQPSYFIGVSLTLKPPTPFTGRSTMSEGIRKLRKQVAVSRLSSPIKSSTSVSREYDAGRSSEGVKKKHLCLEKPLAKENHKQRMERGTKNVDPSLRCVEDPLDRRSGRKRKITQRAEGNMYRDDQDGRFWKPNLRTRTIRRKRIKVIVSQVPV